MTTEELRQAQSCPAGYFASSQFGPNPTSATSGTVSVYAPSIVLLTVSAIAFGLTRRRFDHEFVMNLQE